MSAVAVEPKVEGFPWADGYPSWVVWTGQTWQVTYGDDACGILDGGPSGAQVITVSAAPYAGNRWFETDDPRGLAAALLAAADASEVAL